MSTRELILLSPYRLPTQNTLYLGDDEVAAFLNGYIALWHPAALAGAAAPPRVGSPYDYEQPTAGHLYAVPENPPLMLPDDWDQRVVEAGALAFRATADREQTLTNLRAALEGRSDLSDAGRKLLALPRERYGPFLGIGFGHLQLEALCEAMSHENLLSAPDLWGDVAAALAALDDADPDAWRRHLQVAADRLLSAREVLYPVTIHLIDLALLDEKHPEAPWPASFERGQPLNLLACAALLQRIAKEQPERHAALCERLGGDLAEVIGGPYLEREDALLPLESQLWNLLKGQEVYQELLGQEVRVFGRRRFGHYPQLPLLLQSVGISRALLVSFDESVLPAHRSVVVSWPSLDGKQVETFTRTPHHADTPQTGFHLAHYLHQTIMQDQAATLALLHRGKPAGGWYDDLLELSRFAPVLGRFSTLSGYFNEVLPGDYTSAASPDEFHGDYLVERTPFSAEPSPAAEYMTEQQPAPPAEPQAGERHPVSGFARQVRGRRRLDTAWTLAAILRGLNGRVPDLDGVPFETRLTQLEDRFESDPELPEEELLRAQDQAAEALAGRLVARGQPDNPGFLVLNPCSFKRRVALDLPGLQGAPPVGGPVKAAQADGGTARVVVEVPALGFAWVPRRAQAGGPVPAGRMRLADERCVRNEFFEAEIDPQTGGLRAIRDHRTRISRVGQQLVYNPGSTMRAQQVQVTSAGPALGELVTEGVLVDAQEEVLATFRQRFRAWLGRPVLELRVEITPKQPALGYPWHAYFGARFAWRDERATLLRGVTGLASVTSHTRPETPDYLEIREGRQGTVLFPGGLPFHQRHGGRMLDVVLVPEGETCQAFDLGVGLDRDYPMQTALGMVTPVAVVPTDRGPPHVGAEGWLFHLDAPNLLLSSLRPAPDGADGITARLLECGGHGGPAELRCVRDPQRAMLLDARGTAVLDAAAAGDAVQLDVSANDLIQVRVDFS
jgi:hypothetical protein